MQDVKWFSGSLGVLLLSLIIGVAGVLMLVNQTAAIPPVIVALALIVDALLLAFGK